MSNGQLTTRALTDAENKKRCTTILLRMDSLSERALYALDRVSSTDDTVIKEKFDKYYQECKEKMAQLERIYDSILFEVKKTKPLVPAGKNDRLTAMLDHFNKKE